MIILCSYSESPPHYRFKLKNTGNLMATVHWESSNSSKSSNNSTSAQQYKNGSVIKKNVKKSEFSARLSLYFSLFHELIVLESWNQLACEHWITVLKSFKNMKLLWHRLEKTVKIVKIHIFCHFLKNLTNQSPEEPRESCRVKPGHFECANNFLETDFSLLVGTKTSKKHHFFVKMSSNLPGNF